MFVSGRRRDLAGVTAVVQNGEHYTYFHDRPVDLARGADARRRHARGRRPAPRGVLGSPSLLVRALRGGVAPPPGRRLGRATRDGLERGGRPLPLQVDGDYIGEVTEARFRSVRGR